MRYFIIEERYSGLDREVMMSYRQEVTQEEFITLHTQWAIQGPDYQFLRIVDITPTEITAACDSYV